MKRLLSLALVLVVLGICCACGENNHQVDEVNEEVRTVQRKIDKALESTHTYNDLIEIRNLYDDLLKAEQELILNYDKIEDMFTLSEKEVAAIFAANELKTRLKNPHSLEIISASVVSKNAILAIKIDYSATNDIGGTVEDDFYCLVDTPIHDKSTAEWSCKLENVYESYYNLEIINSVLGSKTSLSSQSYAHDKYDSGKAEALDVEKLSDNMDLKIGEIN